ncbi:hypothetical protein [Actinomadura sp. NTSP31]|uniref:hypothetical protein n=1 Tax=Actinomadura sp. NTSP31 TaxID=1735447 RepID=UPI0035C01BC1
MKRVTSVRLAAVAAGPTEGVRQPGPRRAPGFVASTYTSPDGRIQFAVSMTVAGDTQQREAASRRISDAVKTVFCPGT